MPLTQTCSLADSQLRYLVNADKADLQVRRTYGQKPKIEEPYTGSNRPSCVKGTLSWHQVTTGREQISIVSVAVVEAVGKY